MPYARSCIGPHHRLRRPLTIGPDTFPQLVEEVNGIVRIPRVLEMALLVEFAIAVRDDEPVAGTGEATYQIARSSLSARRRMSRRRSARGSGAPFFALGLPPLITNFH